MIRLDYTLFNERLLAHTFEIPTKTKLLEIQISVLL